MDAIINTPTAASLLIDALSPKQRAFLFDAINNYQALTETTLDIHLNENTQMDKAVANRITEFHRWSIKEAKELKNVLFAECFPEDLELQPYFSKELPPLPSTDKTPKTLL